MCVIVAKEKNVGLPTYKQLLNCFEYNNDGAGFMYVNNGKVVIDKGYMTWKKFYKRYQKLCRKFNNFENQSLIMHFRIGTSSGNTPQNTHPYPISNKVNDLHRLYTKTDLGMVHNGIIHDYTPKDKLSNTNDTQEFILKYVSTLYNHYPKFYKDKYIMNGLDDITDSKLAFMDTTGYIYYVGNFIDEEGIKFSNSSYEDWETLYYPTMKYGTSQHSYYNDNAYYDSLIDKYEKKEEELIALESNWYVEYDGKWEEVGDRVMCWDTISGELYEFTGGRKQLISEDVIVYDENYEFVY
jgi:predicted glutamine amidotransferase